MGGLLQELAAVDERRAIVFVNTKRHCDLVSKQLEGGWNCCVLHGGKTQVSPLLNPPFTVTTTFTNSLSKHLTQTLTNGWRAAGTAVSCMVARPRSPPSPPCSHPY
jgi:hypothetical protein